MDEIKKKCTNVIDHSEIDDEHWSKFRYGLMRKFKLTSNEVQLYGFLYLCCKEYKPDRYWCGLSNENLANNTCLSIKALKKALKTLKDKNLIVIENQGTGLRKIYINDYVYLNKRKVEEHENTIEQIKNAHAQEIKQLNDEIKRLTELLSKQDAAAVPNAYVHRFIKAKYIKKTDIPRAIGQLNDLYRAFMFEFGVSELEYHIDYMLKELASKQTKDVIAYLTSAVGNRAKHLASKPKQEKNVKISQNPTKRKDWLDRMHEMSMEPDDPEETARLQAELAEIMAKIKQDDSELTQPDDDEQLSFDF